LALEIWEQLGERDMDTSTLSRVLSGERLFTGEQLKAYCNILNLKSQEEIKLKKALDRDLNDRYGLDIPINIPENPEIDFFRSSVKLAHEMRITSLPWKTIEWVNQINSTIDVYGTDKYPEMAELEARACEEKLRSICEVYSPTGVFEAIPELAFKLTKLSEKTKNPEFAGIALSGLADRYYMNGKYAQALKLFTQAEKNLHEYSEERILTLRTLSICLAELKKTAEFQNISEYLLGELKNYDHIFYSSVYETLGRGFAKIGNFKKAIAYQERAEKSFDEYIPQTNYLFQLKRIQLYRSRMELAVKSRSEVIKRDIDKVKKQATALARRFNSIRYLNAIDKLAAAI
jgi:tetratricopeptide (TPR) repeat protein